VLSGFLLLLGAWLGRALVKVTRTGATLTRFDAAVAERLTRHQRNVSSRVVHIGQSQNLRLKTFEGAVTSLRIKKIIMQA
jgi:hypothetical protein